jgi:hypothetical protein
LAHAKSIGIGNPGGGSPFASFAVTLAGPSTEMTQKLTKNVAKLKQN